MSKRVGGLRYAAALVAILHASLMVHAIHPLFHSQSVSSQTCAASQSQVGCNQACCQQHSGSAAASPSAGAVGADCQICKFLVHFQSRDGFSGDCRVSPDAARETNTPLSSNVYIAAIHSPANARAPPAPFSSVTAA
jgi:hypothetical protein